MNLVRGMVAIVVGYLLLAVVAMGVVASLFGDSTEPDFKAIVFAMSGLAVGALIAGFIATWVVGTANHPALYITLGVLIAMTVRAFLQGQGIEPDWYRFAGTLTQVIGFLVGASTAAHRMGD